MSTHDVWHVLWSVRNKMSSLASPLDRRWRRVPFLKDSDCRVSFCQNLVNISISNQRWSTLPLWYNLKLDTHTHTHTLESTGLVAVQRASLQPDMQPRQLHAALWSSAGGYRGLFYRRRHPWNPSWRRWVEWGWEGERGRGVRVSGLTSGWDIPPFWHSFSLLSYRHLIQFNYTSSRF